MTEVRYIFRCRTCGKLFYRLSGHPRLNSYPVPLEIATAIVLKGEVEPNRGACDGCYAQECANSPAYRDLLGVPDNVRLIPTMPDYDNETLDD